MLVSPVSRYHSKEDMREAIALQIKELEKQIDEYSKLIGEKIRIAQESGEQDEEFNELKAKLQGTDDDPKNKTNKNKTNKNKTKKKKSKKQKSTKWFELDGVQIFNEMGLKGELELYFEAVEFLNERLENLQKIKKTVDGIIDKGLKDDMSCIVYHELNMPYQIAFQKSNVQRKKFSFKSTIEAIPTTIEVPAQ